MRLYLDTSALVKLYVDEADARVVRNAVGQADLVTTSVLAYVEARAAFARRRREGGWSPGDHRRITRDLDTDWAGYLAVEVTDAVIRKGARLSETHRLKAYDAVHLASAAVAHGRLGEPSLFASWDRNLDRAARREGLALLRPLGRD